MSHPVFFSTRAVALGDLAEKIGATLAGGADGKLMISSAAPVEEASQGDLTFLDNAKYLQAASQTKASAIVCKEQHKSQMPEGIAILVHEKPYAAYGAALCELYPEALRPPLMFGEEGVSPQAIIGENCQLEDGVVIEPGAIIGKGVSIGRGSHIHANAVIGQNVQIGRNTSICANASVSNALIGDEVIIHPGVRIGADGFGFAMGPGGHRKLPQIGRVIIQDRVDIGANSTVDRGANRDTVIGEGTKIDNLVQIGHNAVIGRHCVIVGLSGVSGSATLGDFVVVAGQTGIVGHITVGDGAQIGGGSGVHGNVAPGEKMMGYPAIPARIWMRQAAKIMRDAKMQTSKNRGTKE